MIRFKVRAHIITRNAKSWALKSAVPRTKRGERFFIEYKKRVIWIK
jgi:hypothetical protein